MPRRVAPPSQIYQLKISLNGSSPPIWRRVEVDAASTLAQLHTIIQAAMGWEDYHLHQFSAGSVSYGVPHPEDFDEVSDERRARLNQLISAPKQKLVYEYDFGDDWQHTLLLEKVLAPEEGVTYPRCTAGKRSCPPEDCGGIWGYESLLEAIGDPNHSEHDTMLEWVSGEFDPVAFDLDAVNASLGALR